MPNKKLRGFMWSKIPPRQIKNTIWENANDEAVELDSQEIEELFGIEEQEKKATTANDKDGDANKPTVVRLLDPKRAQQIGIEPPPFFIFPFRRLDDSILMIEIMLRGLKTNHVELRKALEAMSEAELTADKLKAIQKYLPLPEEVSFHSSYEFL